MLQRLALAFRTPDLMAAGLVHPRLFVHNRRLEILDTFNFDEETTTHLLRVVRRPEAPRVDAPLGVLLERYHLQALEVLEDGSDSGEFTVVVRQRNSEGLQGILREVDPGLFPLAPCQLESDESLFTLGGPSAAVAAVPPLLHRLGLPHRVQALGPYRPRVRDNLTPRQIMALGLALDLGYFELPRRTDLRTLGRIMGVSPVALGKLLRRAEEKLVREALGQTGGPRVPP